MKQAKSIAWQRLPITSLCEAHVDCVNRTAPLASETTPFKMLRTTNVRHGYVDVENVRYVTEETYKKWTRRLVPRRGDVVLTREAPLGDVGKIRTDDKVFLGQRLYHFRPDPTKLDADFLLYSLLGGDLQSQIRGFGSGSTVEHMRLEDIPSLEFDVPPLPVQQRIAGILSAYDELIQNSQRRIKILESMARALYREWFVHFRFPGHEHHPRIASSLGEIPMGWQVRTLAELCTRMESGGTPRRSNPEFWDAGDIDWYKTGELWDGFLFGSQEQITARGQRESTARLFEPGTILMAIYGSPTVGRMGILTRQASCNQAALGLVANKTLISQTYLYFVLFSLRDHFNSLAQGAAQQNISKEKVASALAIMPTRNLLDSFDRNAAPVFAQIQTLQRQVHNLRRTRDLLLPRLLSGQIEVEPA